VASPQASPRSPLAPAPSFASPPRASPASSERIDARQQAVELLAGSMCGDVLIGSARLGAEDSSPTHHADCTSSSTAAAATMPAMVAAAPPAVPVAPPPQSPVRLSRMSWVSESTPRATPAADTEEWATPMTHLPHDLFGSPTVPPLPLGAPLGPPPKPTSPAAPATAVGTCTGDVLGQAAVAVRRAVFTAPASWTLLSPPPPAAHKAGLQARAFSTPGRRVPGSHGASALFRETPSPRAGMPNRDRSSPLRAQPFAPRSLFATPSPPRYDGVCAEADIGAMTWATPLAFHQAGGSGAPSSSSLGVGGGTLRVPVASGGTSSCCASKIHSFPKSSGATFTPSPSPVRCRPVGAPLSKATVPPRSPAGFQRSPSAPDFRGPPLITVVGQHRLVARPAIGGGRRTATCGDTPRNLTDWRQTLQFAQHQRQRTPPQNDDPLSAGHLQRPKRHSTPWR
jgi:hypothetical protein